jgi:hypothetical protein
MWNYLFFFILVVNQLDAQNLFYNKFIPCLYTLRESYAHRQEVKTVLYSLWYHHTETSEWSKMTKITKIYKYEHIVVKFHYVLIFIYILVILVILVILDHSLVSVCWYQRLYNAILTSWRWAYDAWNMKRHEINLLQDKFCASIWLTTNTNILRFTVNKTSQNMKLILFDEFLTNSV